MKRIFFLILMVGLVSLAATAQDAKPILPTIPLDPETVLGFAVALFGGVGVKGITEMAKKLLGVSGALAVALSALVSVGAVAWFYVAAHMSLNVVYFIIYAALVFLQANGLYKAGKPTS